MGNPFVYVQLHTRDLEGAQSFYGPLFDWKFDVIDTPAGPYVEIRVGEGTGGGMTTTRGPEIDSHWCPYVLVEDIRASTERAESLGATVALPPTQLPDGSWFSRIEDPTGAPLAMHQRTSG
jgi:predicted enzyme related to lactoylglutathione lyase